MRRIRKKNFPYIWINTHTHMHAHTHTHTHKMTTTKELVSCAVVWTLGMEDE